MKHCLISLLFFLSIGNVLVQGQAPTGLPLTSPSPDNAQGALDQLLLQRQSLMVRAIGPASLGKEMFRLGMWGALGQFLRSSPDRQYRSLRVQFAIAKHQYFHADSIVKVWLEQSSTNREARLWAAKLHIQAWELPQAEDLAQQLLEEFPQDPVPMVLLGEVALLQKQYALARQRADQAIAWDSLHADAWYLKGETNFWLRDVQAAEDALRQCLTLDPYHPDARFAYGYAIWRRVDATQLPQMAAQWDVALAANPLHFRTHWHWGNGHTHLTYADYADPKETEIRAALRPADDLITVGKMDSALVYLRQIEKQYPASVIPTLHRASAWYMHYERALAERLDSAQRLFQDILVRKPHYGPAHNGLAAVIKQRQFPYLRMYDSLERVIRQTTIADEARFVEVFPDVVYYPGNRVQKMVWNQLYSSVAYFPFLAKLGRQFVIPPLHVDLAKAMNNRYFRYGTTFDNRQWMDIRGVGSGATGIEYVERAAHLERNVTLHEYVHLFHGWVFTDQESRMLRKRYYHAMENELTLDYYSANNESEYLAQTFTAYFIPLKVHPLNHKSVNTRGDLQAKDPLMFAFIDSLVRKQRRYLAGDRMAMADNWANVYLQLAKWSFITAQKFAYLDTAYQWDSSYVPIYLAYADMLLDNGQPDSAQTWLARAAEIAPDYPPLYRTYATHVQQAFEAGDLAADVALRQQIGYLEQAFDKEEDAQLRAELAVAIRDGYLRFGRWQKAIEQAEQYALDAPDISTYLRDQRDEARAIAHYHRGLLGYQRESLRYLATMVAQHPQRFQHRVRYAEVLLAQGRATDAREVVEGGLRILRAAGQRNADLEVLLAQAQLTLGDTAAAQQLLADVEHMPSDLYRVPHLWLAYGDTSRVRTWQNPMSPPMYPAEKASHAFLNAQYALATGEEEQAEAAFQRALDANPYLFPARFSYLEFLMSRSRTQEAQRLAEAGMLLPLPPGPAIKEQLRPFLQN